MEEIMNFFKCLMGILLSAVLIVGSAFAANTLTKNNELINGYALKDVKAYWFSGLSVKINSIKPLIRKKNYITITSNGGNNEFF